MSSQKAKIMIVDDSEIVREMVSMTLEDGGYEVIAMESPLGFTNVLRKHLPDLVLMDVSMPALPGNKLVEFARTRLPDCAIVLHSDRPEAELAQLVKDCGALGYIRKTGDGAAFLRSIEKFIRKQPAS